MFSVKKAVHKSGPDCPGLLIFIVKLYDCPKLATAASASIFINENKKELTAGYDSVIMINSGVDKFRSQTS